MISARPSNWLPLPISARKPAIAAAQTQDIGLFPVGEIVRFLPHKGTGLLKIRGDAEVAFAVDELDLIPLSSRSKLTKGIKVGYDISRTSHGLRVSKLKVV